MQVINRLTHIIHRKHKMHVDKYVEKSVGNQSLILLEDILGTCRICSLYINMI
jgi:hypothetical protein